MLRIPANLRVKMLKKAIANGLNLLTYDIETSHMLVRTFYIGQKVSIQHTQIKEPSKVISIQYQFQDMPRAKYLQWTKLEENKFSDSEMIREFALKILPKADIILGQNSDRFDFLTLNERAKALHLPTLQSKPSIDILKLSRKSFKSASHKLDYRSVQQNLGGKIRMSDQDWVDIEERGVPVSKKMAPYGCKDVEDTNKLFWKELPYYKDLPTAIEKVIMSFIPDHDFEDISPKSYQKKIRCQKCIDKKRNLKTSAGCTYDVKVLNQRASCNQCGHKWRIK